MSVEVADLYVTLRSISDPFSKGLKSAAADAESSSKRMTSALATVAKAGAGIAVGLTGIAVESVKMASTFNAQMTLLQTQAGVSKNQIAGLSDGVLSLAGQVGFSPTSLAEALFHVESSFASTGITGTQALNLLKVAAEGAATGHANLVDVTNALDAAVVSGIPGVSNLTEAMGELNATVGAGDMTMQDLANAFSTGLLANVKSYGLTFRDVGAALAVFGDNNMRGQIAATDLRMAVQAMAKPANTASVELGKMGLQTDSLAKVMSSGGLLPALQLLHERMTKIGVTAKDQGAVLTDLFGKKAGAGIVVLYDQLTRLESKYPDLAKGATGFADAWTATKATFAQQVKEIGAEGDALAIRLGNALIPQLTRLMTAGQSDIGQAVAGFSGAALKPPAHDNLHNAFLNKDIAPAAPPLTGWQKFGQEIHQVVGDIEDGAKRLEPIGMDFVRFGDDVWQSLGKIAPVAEAVGHDLGVTLFAGAEAAGKVFANVLGPAIKDVADFIGGHQEMIRIFADVILGGLALKMGVLGSINAAKGIIGLATAIVQFPMSQAGQITTALDELKTAWSGKEAQEGEQAVKGLAGAFGDLKTKASGALGKILPDSASLAGLAKAGGDLEKVGTEAKSAGDQLSLFETTEQGVVQLAGHEQLALFGGDLAKAGTAAEGAAEGSSKAGGSILGLAGSIGKTVLPLAAIITGAGLLGNYLGHLGGVGRSAITDMDAFGQSLSQAAGGSAQAQAQINGLVQAINAAPFHTGAASMGDIDKALTQLVTGGHAMDAQTEFDQITHALQAQGISAQDAAAKFPQYEQALKNVTDAAKSADGQVQGLLGTLAQQQAVDQFNTDLNNLSTTIMNNGRGLTGNTAAAIANRQAVQQGASDIENYYNTQRNAGVGIEKATADMQTQVDQLEKTGMQAGFAKGDIDNYLKSLGLIPRDIATSVTLNLNTGSAYKALNGLIQTIDSSVGYVQITGTGGGMYAGGKALLTKDEGGFIPGAVNQPVLMIGHGGEYVVSNDMQAGRQAVDPRVLSGVGASSGRAAGGMGGASVVNNIMNVNIAGSLTTEDRALSKLRGAQAQWSRRNGGTSGWSATTNR